jgi:hypothetical protein
MGSSSLLRKQGLLLSSRISAAVSGLVGASFPRLDSTDERRLGRFSRFLASHRGVAEKTISFVAAPDGITPGDDFIVRRTRELLLHTSPHLSWIILKRTGSLKVAA